MVHIDQHYWDIPKGEVLSSTSSVQQCFTSLSPALLFHSGLPSPQLTFPPLQPFILQMLAWLCGLSSQHKGCSVDNSLASAWAPASVICPRQPLTKPRGGQAWAGHEALKESGATRHELSHSCERRVSCTLLIPFSQSVIHQTIYPSYKETGSLKPSAPVLNAVLVSFSLWPLLTTHRINELYFVQSLYLVSSHTLQARL